MVLSESSDENLKGHSVRIWLGVFGLLLSVVYFILAITTLSLGTISQPGSGLFPVIISIILAVSSGALLFEKGSLITLEGEAAENMPKGENLIRLALICGSILLAIIVLPFLGFVLTFLPFTFFVLNQLGTRKWYRDLIIAVVFSGAAYYLFVVLLGVPLPSGLFG